MAYKLPSDISMDCFGEESVLCSQSGTLYALNPTSTIILKSLLAGLTETEIVSAIRAKYATTRATAEKDVAGCIQQLKEYRLLVSQSVNKQTGAEFGNQANG